MKKVLCSLWFAALCSACGTINGIKTSQEGSIVSLANDHLKVEVDLSAGTYCAIDLKSGNAGLYNATFGVNGLLSNAPNAQRTHQFKKTPTGAALAVTATTDQGVDYTLNILLGATSPALELTMEATNQSDSAIKIHALRPIASAQIFEGEDMSVNFRAVDGQGGGAATYIRQSPALHSHNNLIVHFGTDQNYRSLVAGGVSYAEFAKYAQIAGGELRFKALAENGVEGLALVDYHNLGTKDQAPKTEQARIVPVRASSHTYDMAGGYEECKSLIYDSEQLTFDLKGLQATQSYTFGVTAADDKTKRSQSIWLDIDGRRTQILPATPLHDLRKDKNLYTYYFPLPASAATAKSAKVIVKKEQGLNVVANEVILLSGTIAQAKEVVAKEQQPDYESTRLQLTGQDAVGKRIDPKTTYCFEKDAFYVDFVTRNPMESAEQYAATLKDRQEVKLNYYTFPTICLWYAMEPRYGGDKVMGTNDTPGAVDEMRRVKESGWLKYETMGIRLVPDCYGENNQNGWWDEAHWQRHGSGIQHPGMALKGGHYRAPYETTKKWAQAIRDLGGLPFTYFQTAVRSQDYAEAFPQHMLFNTANHPIDYNDWLNKGRGAYDFTDTGFVAHMRDVYTNLRDGGVQGLMFDYPYTGWVEYGGMDDPYATTLSAYRRIYALAHEGLGEGAYVHERNLTHGSDGTLNLVESQRTWGDTDIITPEMVMRSGMRWYKNRVVINYDMDAKNLLKSGNDDGLHKMLTMSYVTASRLLLANSFGTLTPYHVQKLSRIFPFQTLPRSARPLDAFSSDYPRAYGLMVSDGWLALTLFNEANDTRKSVSIALAGIPGRAGAGLDPQKEYYAYDFWNDQLVGKFDGEATLTAELRPGEARQIAVRQVENHPQILSTDRHLMQGLVELQDVAWSDDRLSGKAQLVEGETMKIVVALNGKEPKSATADAGTQANFELLPEGLAAVTLTSDKGGSSAFVLHF